MASKHGQTTNSADRFSRRGVHLWGYAGLVLVVLVTIGILELVR
jgi:hypothetical protein